MVETASLPPAVTVCNAYGHETAMAEYAVMAMLVWSHRYFDIAVAFRGGSWRDSGVMNGPLHRELVELTVGIVGLGQVGRETATRAAALGCHVLGANRTIGEPPPGVARVFPLAELDRMLPLCDVLALCVGLAPETRGLLDARRFALMKRDAFLINVGRGPVADEDALFAALRDGMIGGAALDTWYRYRPPRNSHPALAPSVSRIAQRRHDAALLGLDRGNGTPARCRRGAQHRPLHPRREAAARRRDDLNLRREGMS